MSKECEGQEPLNPERREGTDKKITFHKKSQEADDDTLEQIEKEKDRDEDAGDE